jgi:hypothetical protein
MRHENDDTGDAEREETQYNNPMTVSDPAAVAIRSRGRLATT